jgi:hypothetical protein
MRESSRALSGFSDDAALGISRKFWYCDELSVPLNCIASPSANIRRNAAQIFDAIKRCAANGTVHHCGESLQAA